MLNLTTSRKPDADTVLISRSVSIYAIIACSPKCHLAVTGESDKVTWRNQSLERAASEVEGTLCTVVLDMLLFALVFFPSSGATMAVIRLATG